MFTNNYLRLLQSYNDLMIRLTNKKEMEFEVDLNFVWTVDES